MDYNIVMRKIVLYPAKILREMLPVVIAVDRKLMEDVANLSEILEKSDNGAGLAANQIESEKRFFGVKNGKTKKVDIFINPKIVQTYGEKVYPMISLDDGGEEDFLEGCLSFPDYFGTVKRYLKIETKWEEIEGSKLIKKKRTMNGFEAIVFQHEADHLDGVLFVDHIKREGGKFYKWEAKEKIIWDVDKVIEGKL
jgi:peptide deformylase